MDAGYINLATIFSGIGAIEWALKRLQIKYNIVFACDNGDRTINIDYNEEYKKILHLKNPEEKSIYVENLYDYFQK